MKRIDKAYIAILGISRTLQEGRINYKMAEEAEKCLDWFLGMAGGKETDFQKYPETKELASTLFEFYKGHPSYIMKSPRLLMHAGTDNSFKGFKNIDIAMGVGLAAAEHKDFPVYESDEAGRIMRKYRFLLNLDKK